MKILDIYNTAIHATNLKSKPETTWSPTDVLAAAGLAARYEPLGIALARMLSGGGKGQVVEILTHEGYHYSHKIKNRVTWLQAEDISKAVLAWYSHGTCKQCDGLGLVKIEDTPSLGAQCKSCEGQGKIDFDKQFRHEWRPIARWLHDQIGKAQARAGQEAMKKIAKSMEL